MYLTLHKISKIKKANRIYLILSNKSAQDCFMLFKFKFISTRGDPSLFSYSVNYLLNLLADFFNSAFSILSLSFSSCMSALDSLIISKHL